MGKVRRVDFSPDEFLTGVSNLKHDEIGPYWIACCLMYSRGGPIADDDSWIAKACGCHVRTWRAIKARLLAIGKLAYTDDGELTNGRTMRELGLANERIENAHEAAQESVRRRREKLEARLREARQDGEKQGDLLENNDLERPAALSGAQAITNHQPPTTNTVTTSRTEEGGRADARATAKTAQLRRESLPEDWQPPDDQREWAVSTIAATNNVGRVDVDREVLKFRTYWKDRGVKSARGWKHAWENWIWIAIERSESNGSSIGRKSADHDQPRRYTNAQRQAAFVAGLRGPGDRGPADDDGGA